MGDRLQSLGGWVVQPEAEKVLAQVLERMLAQSPLARRVAESLLENCGIRLRDILDHIGFDDPQLTSALVRAGWRSEGGTWRHPRGLFPDFIEGSGAPVLAIRCESAERFAATYAPGSKILGPAFGPYRICVTREKQGIAIHAVERHGHLGYDMPNVSDAQIRAARLQLQRFRSRRREFDSVPDGLDHTEQLVAGAVETLGQHWSCQLFFSAEREYWMRRCAAGRRQYKRQQPSGIGWSNVDHHTYDSSRQWFAQTIRILERLGYECRELLYAGDQAGWGSQILEQPALGSTIFADIDLAPDELALDFAHLPLAPLEKYRRAGVWCTVHGESMLEAGLNHVAGMYDQKALRRQLGAQGLKMMSPFSNYPELYQELTEGEWWAVDPARIDALERGGHLEANEAESFRLNGAIGSHLENLERNFGFKGFNQPGIDGVLRIIDPRRNLVEKGAG